MIKTKPKKIIKNWNKVYVSAFEMRLTRLTNSKRLAYSVYYALLGNNILASKTLQLCSKLRCDTGYFVPWCLCVCLTCIRNYKTLPHQVVLYFMDSVLAGGLWSSAPTLIYKYRYLPCVLRHRRSFFLRKYLREMVARTVSPCRACPDDTGWLQGRFVYAIVGVSSTQNNAMHALNLRFST